MHSLSFPSKFDLTNKVAVITGGAGLLGIQHAEAIAEYGGNPVILDIDLKKAERASKNIENKFNVRSAGLKVDITSQTSVLNIFEKIIHTFSKVDILINNAANDPKVKKKDEAKPWSRFEEFPIDIWNQDIAVGLTGAFICSKVFGSHMASNKKGVILNIASDLGVIAPDQRIYEKPNKPKHMQEVKPVTYSVVKTGIIGLTKYLATYWANDNIRVNSISPGGVYNDQPDDFVEKLTNLIPMKRMATKDEYKSAIVFLVSEASSYMTGSNLVIDGGRTCW